MTTQEIRRGDYGGDGDHDEEAKGMTPEEKISARQLPHRAPQNGGTALDSPEIEIISEQDLSSVLDDHVDPHLNHRHRHRHQPT